MYNPTVIDNNGKSERAYDIYSRLLIPPSLKHFIQIA